MHRTLRQFPLVLALCSMLACAMFCSATDEPPVTQSAVTFRSEVTEVRLAFSTTDQNNRVLATVQPGDFAIVDQDMVVRDFRSFTRSEFTRLDITVLIDASESTTPQFRQELANVIQVIAQTEGVPDDGFSIVSFQDLRPSVICEGNCRALNAEERLPLLKSGGMTPLYDSIVFAVRRLGRDNDLHARKILLLFSDGVDTISLKSFMDAIESALNNDVSIYSVDVSSRPHTSPGTLVLHSFSVNTGGRYFTLEAGTSKVVDAVLEDFHATYTVAYKLPSRAAGFHQVRILPTHNLSLQFHCRRGYYYPSNPGN